MTLLMGRDAIDHLASRVGTPDPGESSHWRAYHANFEFSGDGFSGLQGFGGSERPPRGWRAVAHRLLQRPYRRIGAGYAAFGEIDRLAAQITARQDRAYDLDVLRQSLTLAFLKHHAPQAVSGNATVAVIGDGFASMTSLLVGSRSARRVILVNLTKTLLVDLWYLRSWLGEAEFASQVGLVTDPGGLDAGLAARGPRVVAIEAANHELLRRCPLDLAINVASMQEMNPAVIEEYFTDLRAAGAGHARALAFYCCNRVEKWLPDGTITRFESYPWRAEDDILVDELCPWHQRHYRFRPPFYRPFDGPTRHRLVLLSPVATHRA